MAKTLSSFRALDGLDGVYVAENGGLRCSAVRLKGGGLCLFSPVAGLGPEALASLKALGGVRFLLAPNHYHHKGVAEYAEAFPEARLCAPEAAGARLAKVTGLDFEALDDLKAALADDMALIATEGLKTGEVWLRAQGPAHVAWLVVDAFNGPKGEAVSSEPGLLGPFPKFGVGERDVYRKWAERQIGADNPTMIVPCHGAVVCDPNLPAKLLKLVTEKI